MTGNSNQQSVLGNHNPHRAASQHETIAAPGSLYIPSLDGIRAVSFLLVFLAHAGLGDVVPGGFGVSVFFLLSGFLITTLLRTEFDRYQRISLGNFYLRRALRILPPMYVVLLLAMALSLLGNGQAIPLGGTVAQALQVSNYYEIFARHPLTMPGSGVLWSLAVEEHFYLVFPLLYIWLRGRFSVRSQAVVLVALCAAALAWRCVLRYHFQVESIRTYYATDARFDSILLGCLFAIIANPMFKDPFYDWLLRRMQWLVPLCVALLLGTFLLRDENFRETFRYTVQGLALIPLFIAAIHYQQSLPVLLLNLPFVRFLGVLSYSLYLCHSIIMESIKSAWTTNPVLASVVSLLCAFCFATLVHYGIEKPCARIRKRLSRAFGT